MKSSGTFARLVEGSADSETGRATDCAIRLCRALSAVAPTAAVMEQKTLLDRCFMFCFSLSLRSVRISSTIDRAGARLDGFQYERPIVTDRSRGKPYVWRLDLWHCPCH